MNKLSLYKFFLIIITIPLTLTAAIDTPESIDEAFKEIQKKRDLYEPESMIKYANPSQSQKVRIHRLDTQVGMAEQKLKDLKANPNKMDALENLNLRLESIKQALNVSFPVKKDIIAGPIERSQHIARHYQRRIDALQQEMMELKKEIASNKNKKRKPNKRQALQKARRETKKTKKS